MSKHGGNIYVFGEEQSKIIDFSANINPFGVSERVREIIVSSVDLIVNYPDPLNTELRRSLANYHKIDKDYIVCGNGGADVIFSLTRTVKPKNALLISPTFSEYEDSLREVGANIYYYNLNKNDFSIKENYIDKIDKNIDFLVICNPNNPTGILTEKKLVLEIIKKAKKNNIFVLLDECFNDLIDNSEEFSCVDLLGEFDNLFILRSMTKMHACAGLRLGYGLCGDKKLVEMVRKHNQPWNVNILAAKAGIAMVEDIEYKNKFKNYLTVERVNLQNKLSALGLKVFPSKANYIFFYCDKFIDLQERLLKYKILIRDCSNYKNLEAGYYRIAIKSKENNEYLVKCLEEVLKEDEV